MGKIVQNAFFYLKKVAVRPNSYIRFNTEGAPTINLLLIIYSIKRSRIFDIYYLV